MSIADCKSTKFGSVCNVPVIATCEVVYLVTPPRGAGVAETGRSVVKKVTTEKPALQA